MVPQLCVIDTEIAILNLLQSTVVLLYALIMTGQSCVSEGRVKRVEEERTDEGRWEVGG